MVMLQVRLRELSVEPFVGVGVPNVGGRFALVVKVYHCLLYCSLPVGSVAFTYTVKGVEYERPDSDNDLVPFVELLPLFVCPLLHWIDQENESPSGSLIGMLQTKDKGCPVDPIAG